VHTFRLHFSLVLEQMLSLDYGGLILLRHLSSRVWLSRKAASPGGGRVVALHQFPMAVAIIAKTTAATKSVC
jgi:hypothetical protein